MKWEYPLWRVTEGITLKTNQRVIEGEVIDVYPDNDGNLWFYHPKTGKKVIVK